jgi:anaerobic ribonucleoside-triphosphate reductase activating protein
MCGNSVNVLRLSGIVWESIVDGPGIRCAVFAQGCPHHCAGCHNPQTHDFSGGYESTSDEIIAHMVKDPLLRGITLTGGEPFQQPEAMAELAQKAKAAGYDVVAYTGYKLEQLVEMGNQYVDKMLKHIDILIDGPFVQAEKRHDLWFHGSTNQRIIDVPKFLSGGRIKPIDPRF